MPTNKKLKIVEEFNLSCVRNEMATRKEMYSSFIKKEYPNVKYNSQKFKRLMAEHACIVKEIIEVFSHYTEQEILDDFDNITYPFYKKIKK